MDKNFNNTNKPHNWHEKEAWASNNLICGIDEVGRGCLAGPVVVSAVILFAQKKSSLLKDSKILSKVEMKKAYSWIIRNSCYSVGILSHRFVDKNNIYQSTLSAMKRATLQLLSTHKIIPQKILVDAMPLTLSQTAYENIPVEYFPFGEHVSSSIAAASIIAKVTRDNILKRLDSVFPGYSFNSHKGYQTKKHVEALDFLGKSLIHRDTYLKKYFLNKRNKDEKQQSMFR